MSETKLLPWTNYTDERPSTAGVYEWRVPSVAVSGLVVIIAAHMRKRGAGYEDVLSPSFDYWNGYQVLVPVGLQWREPVSEHVIPKTHGSRIIGIEGMELSPCVYCGKTPEIKASHDTGRGMVISPHPQDLNSWRFECCRWGTTPFGNDPRELEAMRGKVHAPALTPKQEAAEEMFEALKDLEWANDGRCPQCSNRFVENHQPKCILAAALTKAGRA